MMLDIWNGLLHLIYPKVCAGCGTDLAGHDQLICLECMDALPLTGFHQHDDNPVKQIFRGRLDVSCASSYVYFTKQSVMQRLLHELKYKGNREVGYFFGRRMAQALKKNASYNDVQALIPMPLHHSREKKRGYNQATVICEGMAEVMQIPVMEKVVRRNRVTETQTRKNRTQRWENIEHTFSLTDKSIAGTHVLLVDDVLTTGATLEACGAELLKVDDVRLGIVTLAYTSL